MTTVILQTLVPVFGLILAGGLLRHAGFLDAAMEQAFNKFCYWIALPVFIVTKVAEAPGIESSAFRGIAAMLLVTAGLFLGGNLLARLMRLPKRSTGTFTQAGFRGNLAYVGIPVIGFALSGQSPEVRMQGEFLAVLIMTPVVLVYNLLAVMVLEWDRRHEQSTHPLGTWVRSTLRNPLILACVAGLIWNAGGLPVPGELRNVTDPVGSTAFPLALMAIGARIRSLNAGHAGRGLAGACLVKNALGLGLAFVACRILDLEGVPALVVMVLASTPTAVATFVLVDQLDGDRDLAAASIAGTTLCSILSLSGALALNL